MNRRDSSLQAFLSSVQNALAVRTQSPETAATMDKIFRALEALGHPGPARPRRLPVCDTWLPGALDIARRHSPALAQVANAFAAVEPALSWAPRSTGGPHAGANWPEGHANAMIVGPAGVEDRGDIQIGVSLLGPHVRYPDHNHGPEEVYLVLSPGRFQHGESDWFEPGIGGTFYNEPNIRHAMASDDAPLFALWFLWAGDPA